MSIIVLNYGVMNPTGTTKRWWVIIEDNMDELSCMSVSIEQCKDKQQLTSNAMGQPPGCILGPVLSLYLWQPMAES
jgi:hypothetical protein